MIATKCYDYAPIDQIGEHPDVRNHRPLDRRKVDHFFDDIQRNGLLEPLVVWECGFREYAIIGGFHRLEAIRRIRSANPGHFDCVDVRVVSGDVDDMRALNLKLNADRMDPKTSDYFETVLHLKSVDWSNAQIAELLDRSEGWVEEIVRLVPGMAPEVREMLDSGKLTWSKAKSICRAVNKAEPQDEKAELEKQLAALEKPAAQSRPKRPVTMVQAKKRLSQLAEKSPEATYTLDSEDLLSLILLLDGKEFSEDQRERVERKLPALFC